MADRPKEKKKSTDFTNLDNPKRTKSTDGPNSNYPGNIKRDTDGNTSVNAGKTRRLSNASTVGVIKAPGGGKKEKETEAVPTGRRKPIMQSEKKGEEKGILKKPSKGRSKVSNNKNSLKEPTKKKVVKKTLFDKIGKYLGFYIGTVTLTDPWAIEAAQALDLRQSHLRTLKTQFDKVDLDSSGNIDFDEFFESIGEARSPFTDKLFALIGAYNVTSSST